MENQKEIPTKPLLSETYKGRGTSYFLDIRLSKKGHPYLSITTSRRGLPDEKPDRQTIFIFEQDIAGFIQAINQLEQKIPQSDQLKTIISQ